MTVIDYSFIDMMIKKFHRVFSCAADEAAREAEALHDIVAKHGSHLFYYLAYHRGMILRTSATFHHSNMKELSFDQYMSVIDSLGVNDEITISLLALLTFHRDGYVRLPAIIRFCDIDPLQRLPLLSLRMQHWDKPIRRIDPLQRLTLLCIRMNDWVNPIRRYAKEAFINIISHAEAKSLLPLLDDAVGWLTTRERYDHSEVIDLLSNKLQSQCFMVLLNNIRCGKRSLARTSYELLKNNHDQFHSVVLAVKKNNSDPIIKYYALRRAEEVLSDSTFYELLIAFKDERLFITRRFVSSKLSSKYFERALTLITFFLFDRSRSVRDVAQYALRKKKIDLEPLYIEKLEQGEMVAPCISGLSEVGSPSCFEIIRPFLSSNNTHISIACVQAIFTLEPLGAANLIVSMYKRGNRKVNIAILKEMKRKPHLVQRFL